jgi:hypothetical protein
MADFYIRLERSIHARAAKPARAIESTLWATEGKQRKADPLSLSASQSPRIYSSPICSVMRPISAADLGTWVPEDLRPAIIDHLDKLQQVPLPSFPPLSYRLYHNLLNMGFHFLGALLSFDNPLKIINVGKSQFREIQKAIRNLVSRVDELPSPAPFSGSTLFAHFFYFFFRQSDGVVDPSHFDCFLRSRLQDPDVHFELLSPAYPVNLLPGIPEELKIKIAGNLARLRPIPLEFGRHIRPNFSGVPLSTRLANYLHDAGFSTLDDCIADSNRMRHMGKKTFLEFVRVLRQVVGQAAG